MGAIAADTEAPLPYLNLAILYDLYLGDAAKAAALYRRCVQLSPTDATQLNRWLAELKTRKPVAGDAAPPATATPATPVKGSTPPTTVASGKDKE